MDDTTETDPLEEFYKKNGYTDVFANVDATEVLEGVRKAVAPELSEEEVSVSQMLAVKETLTGDSTPGVKKSREDFMRLKDVPPEEIMAGKKEAGDDPVESLGGLLSLMIPVLAGAAVGGKRGALYAASGAGSYKMKQMEAEKAARAEEAKEERKFEKQKELEGIKSANRTQLEVMKEEMRVHEESRRKALEKEDWWKDVPVDTKKKILGGPSIINRLNSLADEFEKLPKNSFVFQGDKFISGSAVNDATSLLKILVTDILKKFGETGNIALAERKITMEALEGNWTSNGPDAANRIRRVARTLASGLADDIDAASSVGATGSPDEIKAKLRVEALPDNVRNALKAFKGKYSREQIEAYAEKKGWGVSPDMLDALGV